MSLRFKKSDGVRMSGGPLDGELVAVSNHKNCIVKFEMDRSVKPERYIAGVHSYRIVKDCDVADYIGCEPSPFVN